MSDNKKEDVPSTHRRMFPDPGPITLMSWEATGCMFFTCGLIIFLVSLFINR